MTQQIQTKKKKRGDYCSICHRMIGVSCGCDLPFAEKVRTISVATDWMPAKNSGRKNYYDRESVRAMFGEGINEDAKERMLEETGGAGIADQRDFDKWPELVTEHYLKDNPDV